MGTNPSPSPALPLPRLPPSNRSQTKAEKLNSAGFPLLLLRFFGQISSASAFAFASSSRINICNAARPSALISLSSAPSARWTFAAAASPACSGSNECLQRLLVLPRLLHSLRYWATPTRESFIILRELPQPLPPPPLLLPDPSQLPSCSS